MICKKSRVLAEPELKLFKAGAGEETISFGSATLGLWKAIKAAKKVSNPTVFWAILQVYSNTWISGSCSKFHKD
jgi:hypothetical protein